MADSAETWLVRSLVLSTPYNALAALAIVWPALGLNVIGLPPAGHPIYSLIVGATIAMFGAGYFWQARTRRWDRTFLTLAAAGKFGCVAVVVFYWLVGDLPGRAALFMTGDMFFATMIARWLWATRSGAVTATA